MFFQLFLAALWAFAFPFFNFLSEPNFLEAPAVVCDRPALGKSIVTNTLYNAGDSATGDFNNDGRMDVAVQYGSQSTLAVQFGKGNGQFEEARVIDSNSTSFSVTAADFNNDGKTDLVTLSRVYFGDGAGNFPQSRALQLTTNAFGFNAGDFNGDDKQDVAGYIFSNGTIDIFFGDGLGGFATAAQVAFPNNGINTFEITDINGDGISDVIATLPGVSGLGIALGGTNGFQTPVNFPITGSGSLSTLTSGDVDADGDRDVFAWGSEFGGSAPFTVLFRNNGKGTFTAQPRAADPAGDISRLFLADVNSDNRLDLIGIISRGLYSIRFGNNTGTFQESKLVPAVSGIGKVFYEDATGDGIRDLVHNSTSVNSIGVMIGEGTGNFGVDQKFVDDNLLNDTALGDFNEDGKPDIVTASDSMKVWVAAGDGSGIGSLVALPVSVIPRYVLAGDLNNDNNQDIVAFMQNNGLNKAAVIYGNGNGTFQPAIESDFSDFRLSGGKPALIDIDNDGYTDLVAPSAANINRLGIYRNTGAGSFQGRGIIDVGSLIGGVTVGDFDQDGRTDLAILNGSVNIYLGTGTFVFSALNVFPAGGANAGIYTADINGDGILDLAATQTQTGANGTNGKVAILMGAGKGGFRAPAEYVLGKGPKFMAAADFDGDGNKDLAVTNQGSAGGIDDRISILYGNGQGLFPRISGAIAGISPRGLETADFDSDGKPDLVTSDFSLGLISLARNSCLNAPASNLPTLRTGADINVTEGDGSDTALVVPVTLSAPASAPVRVRYYSAPFTGIAAVADELLEAGGERDYKIASGELTFLPGETSKSVTLQIKGDLTDEFDEKFALYLTNGNNASIAVNRTIITIVDNDAPPTVSISDVSRAEGNSGNTVNSFPVTLSSASEKPILIQYLSGGGTATPTQDYSRVQGSLTIPAGQTQAGIAVNVVGDLTIEPDETFLIDLSDAVNATISISRATGTIQNDDSGGTVRFTSATYTTNDSTNGIQISVTRTGANGGGASVRFRTQAGTATPGQDYAEVSTTILFGDNETTKNVFVPVIIDQLDEPDETVNLILDSVTNATLGTPANAVLTIQDLEEQPNLTIVDAQVVERDTGTATIQFFLRLSRPTQRAVSVQFATANDTATAGVDYVAANGTFTIPPGVTRRSLNLTVLGDFQFEPDETFFVNLTNAVNANLTDNQAVGRILNDEVNTGSSTQLVSINQTETGTANSDSVEPSISADGSVIAFESFASNLAGTDTNNQMDVYVRNILTRETKLVSVNQTGGDSGNCASSRPFVSANGRFVGFKSCANNLLPTVTPTVSVYVRDLQTNQTRLVSTDTNGNPVNGDIVAISADGRYIAYQSRDQNITNIPDTQNVLDIFVRDMQTNITRLATVNAAGTGAGNDDSGNSDTLQNYVKLTPDGRFIIYPSSATNLVSATSTGGVNVFVRDLQNQVTVPVSSNPANTQLVGAMVRSCVSDDGRYAVFASPSGALTPNDTNNQMDIFRRDLTTNTITLVSVNGAGTASGNGGSGQPFCSADARFVSFESNAENLGAPDTNALPDIYWRDFNTNTTKLVSVNAAGTNGGNGFSIARGISADGRIVLFVSLSNNLLDTSIDNNSTFDIFTRDTTANRTNVVSVNETGTTVGNMATSNGRIAANGNVVAFASPATNLVPNDINTTGSDIFAYTKNLPAAPMTDFDGDGLTDLSVFRPSDTVWYITRSSDNGFVARQFGLSQDVPVAGDYDGDGKTDIAVFRSGVWYILYSRNDTFAALSFGAAGDSPVPGDYDGDRKNDLAVFRNGVWQIKESSDGNVREQQFGLAADVPVQADYDGDRRTDIAVFREGVWYVFQSSDFGVRIEQFGAAGDKPAQGDFDGDGKVDFTVFRPSTGVWYSHLSGDGSFLITQWGISTDTPLRGDFDGDRKADIAVFRQGVWYIIRSSNQSFIITQFGVPNDLPIPR